ncbi:MAG TPA: hypothetical protein VNN20_14960, partial [Thermodesulfobacteriota bacterium]|nr:hypothetical protein [Thermodesulfobacteriota bacterium]
MNTSRNTFFSLKRILKLNLDPKEPFERISKDNGQDEEYHEPMNRPPEYLDRPAGVIDLDLLHK